MTQRYRWIEPEPIVDLSLGVSGHPLIDEILFRRGIHDVGSAEAFLSSSLASLGDPLDLPDMELAVDRIRTAIRLQVPIAIFGDYDADGLTSSALLVHALRALGAEVQTYIPHRVRDGYGLNEALTRRIIADGAALLITLDNGSSSGRELALAQEHGLSTIVVDHHQVSDEELPGTAFVSPRRQGSRYPDASLAAVGVTYTLVRALIGDERAEPYLPLVALGTVADVVPLTGENRVLVRAGLERFERDAVPGLLALARAASIDPGQVNCWHLGFALGPRVNAAGRVAEPGIALKLLLAPDETSAEPLARELSRLNSIRQQQTNLLLEQAEEQLARDGDVPPVIVVAGDGWNVGLVGLVAAKLVERYGRPAIVCAREGDRCRGSARSIDGFHIVEALDGCRDLLMAYGGHNRAAGLTIESRYVDELRTRLGAAAWRAFDGRLPQPALRLDAEIGIDDVTNDMVFQLARLEPFGAENEAPRFLLRSVRPRLARATRDGRHVSFKLVQRDGQTVDGIFFDGAHALDLLVRGRAADLACTVEEDTYWGTSRVRLKVIDLRPAADGRY